MNLWAEPDPREAQTNKILVRKTVQLKTTKARSTLATMSKQRCRRSNRQRQCCRFGQQCRSNVRLCRKDAISTQNSFDIVAVFGNKVKRCFDIVAKNGNNVEATFDIVAFDNVASTLLLVWTGLNSLLLTACFIFCSIYLFIHQPTSKKTISPEKHN